MAEKIFPPKNLVYIFLAGKFSFLPPLSYLPPSPPTLLATTTPPTSCRSGISSYQVSLLLLLLSANPVDSNCWTLGCWAAVFTRFYWENNFLELGTSDELWDQGILTEKFPTPSSWRRSVSNCLTLDCWDVVLSTRPRRSCWQNNFGSSWWSVRWRNLNRIMRASYLNRKYSKSTSLNLNCAAKNLTDKFL